MIFPRNIHLLLWPVLAIATTSARAGFPEALAAYQAKDYAKAMTEAQQAATAGDARGSFLIGAMYQNGLGVSVNSSEAVTWYSKAAQGGVVGAFSKLAWANLRGEGTPRDENKALGLARVAAKAGDPEGLFLVCTSLKAGPLRYIDDSGKTDDAKYRKLAARPISERTLDSEAYDALYASAGKGHPMAMLTLATFLGGIVGENNTERMLRLAGQFPDHTIQGLHNYKKVAAYMASKGKTLVSPQVFLDAQLSQHMAATLRTCGLKPKDGSQIPNVELKSVAIAKPLENANYLPTTVLGNEHSYLIKGDWEEDWTYEGCGKSAVVRIRFSADGLGGARFHSVTEGQEISGLGLN